jgi:hypothetical protein
MKIVLAIIWACLFPVINLFMKFGLTYSPITYSRSEKITFMAASISVYGAWIALCIWATTRLMFGIYESSKLIWLVLLPCIFVPLFILHFKNCRTSYIDSIKKFNYINK